MLSRSSLVAIVTITIVGCFTARAEAQSPKLPLVVERAAITPDPLLPAGQNALMIDLYNTGVKSITAWAYWVEFRLGDVTARRGPYLVDVLAATESAKFVIAAGGRRTETVVAPNTIPATPADLSVQITAVIYEDATAAGDDSQLALMFANRSAHRDAWNAMFAIVSEATARYSDPLVVLEQIKADSEAADHKPRTAVTEVQQRVQAGLRNTQPQAAQTAVAALVSFVTSKREMYQAQAVQRHKP